MWKQVRFGDDRSIVGILEEPTETVKDAPLFITLAGLGQAMSEKNYLFSNFRKRMALVEAQVIQFDYMGHGDSLGELGDASIDSMLKDTLKVLVSVIERRISNSNIYIVGNGLGAAVALMASYHCQQEWGVPSIPILISPPLSLPHSSKVFPPGVLDELKTKGKLDSQILVPGFDYYTLSDFDSKQVKYLSRLGAHLLYIHGQSISYKMIQEIDQLNLYKLIDKCENVHVVVGQKDLELLCYLENCNNCSVSVLRNVTYYHEHPSGMDQLITTIEFISGNWGAKT
ncbi:serine aminopeptidase S33 family [Paenibacillus cellulosilyticus]|uniref:Serine aminopeptidase S33 family n=1 Tax=Paenibacillus cellulosilyticus TaxID=375489 RepID=A0A2V2YUR4_9BACL|nr:alpha/beta hydrolase [Paenibacillus cellulosilyticus]PWW03190.1 serine aminopeptidase S33 family [Paenibacillus cellulosilyticus]QKS43680.1 alpha/beta hydrolase [Paenibacillus cellulosilyticus]